MSFLGLTPTLILMGFLWNDWALWVPNFLYSQLLMLAYLAHFSWSSMMAVKFSCVGYFLCGGSDTDFRHFHIAASHTLHFLANFYFTSFSFIIDWHSDVDFSYLCFECISVASLPTFMGQVPDCLFANLFYPVCYTTRWRGHSLFDTVCTIYMLSSHLGRRLPLC